MAIGYLPVLRIWDVYPGPLFFPSRIPDPIRREKSKLVVLPGTFFWSHTFFIIVNYLISFFEQVQENIWVIGTRNEVFLDNPDPDPGGQKGTRYRIRIRSSAIFPPHFWPCRPLHVGVYTVHIRVHSFLALFDSGVGVRQENIDQNYGVTQ